MDTRLKHIQSDSNRFYGLTDLAEYPFISTDCFRFLCGDHIGTGAYRMVFNYELKPGCVIKIAYGTDVKANQMEFEVWNQLRTTKHSKWLAPCYQLSPGGHFLIQKKCRAITSLDSLPKKVPNAFEDLKKENFGFIGKRFVCHDYQFIGRSLDIAFHSYLRDVMW